MCGAAGPGAGGQAQDPPRAEHVRGRLYRTGRGTHSGQGPSPGELIPATRYILVVVLWSWCRCSRNYNEFFHRN